MSEYVLEMKVKVIVMLKDDGLGNLTDIKTNLADSEDYLIEQIHESIYPELVEAEMDRFSEGFVHSELAH